MRVQKGTGVVIYTEPFDDVPSSVTVAAVRASTGATISTAPTATVVGQRVKVTLTAAAHTNTLDDLTLTVSATVATLAEKQTIPVQVVGAHYCTIGSLREEKQLDDQQRYPDALVAEVRDELCEYVEQAADVSFTPRFGEENHVGDGTDHLVLRTNQVRSITAITIDGVSQSLTDFELLAGDRLWRRSGVAFNWHLPVIVQFEHGHDTPPMKLVREVKKAIRSELLGRGAQAPTNMLYEQTADGLTVRYSTPDWSAGRFTGTMTLDAAIQAYAGPNLGFA